MRWYLLKTWVGREEELVREIRRNVPSSLYKECFVIEHERIWRKQQRSIVHTETLFPGCVFLTCKGGNSWTEGMEGESAAAVPRKNDGELAMAVSRMMGGELAAAVPRKNDGELAAAVSRVMTGGGFGNRVLPLMKEDGEFLERLSGEEHKVRLSYVLKDDLGNVCKMTGPLKLCRGQIERMQWKKRYAMVRHRLWGEEQVIVLGIVLKEDTDREVSDMDRAVFSAVEIPVREMA